MKRTVVAFAAGLLPGLVVAPSAVVAAPVARAASGGGAAVAERANAVAAPSPWWGASGPAAGLPGAELPASGAPDAAEVARLRQAYERLSPEDRAAVDQARAYEGFMGRMQALPAGARAGVRFE